MSELDVLTRRLDRLEREYRWWKRTTVLVLLGVVAMVFIGQAQPKERILEAKALKVTDANGVTAMLVGDAVRFYDSSGVRFTLGVRAYGPTVSLADSNGQVRLGLGAMRLEAVPTTLPEQRPASSLVMFDKDGKVIWKAP